MLSISFHFPLYLNVVFSGCDNALLCLTVAFCMLSNWIIFLCFSLFFSTSAVWMYGFTDSPRKEASGSLVCLCQHVEYACTTVYVWERCARCIPYAFSVYFFSHSSFVSTSALHARSSTFSSTHVVRFRHSLSTIYPSISRQIWLADTSAGHRAKRARMWTLSLHVAKLLRVKWGVKRSSLHLSST